MFMFMFMYKGTACTRLVLPMELQDSDQDDSMALPPEEPFRTTGKRSAEKAFASGPPSSKECSLPPQGANPKKSVLPRVWKFPKTRAPSSALTQIRHSIQPALTKAGCEKEPSAPDVNPAASSVKASLFTCVVNKRTKSTTSHVGSVRVSGGPTVRQRKQVMRHFRPLTLSPCRVQTQWQ